MTILAAMTYMDQESIDVVASRLDLRWEDLEAQTISATDFRDLHYMLQPHNFVNVAGWIQKQENLKRIVELAAIAFDEILFHATIARYPSLSFPVRQYPKNEVPA